MITVKYQTVEEYCRCCDQKLPEPKVSDVREFDFSDEDLLGHKEIECLLEDDCTGDIERYVSDFMYETISFYAVSNPDATIEFINDEMEKAMKFILKNYKKNVKE